VQIRVFLDWAYLAVSLCTLKLARRGEKRREEKRVNVQSAQELEPLFESSNQAEYLR